MHISKIFVFSSPSIFAIANNILSIFSFSTISFMFSLLPNIFTPFRKLFNFDLLSSIIPIILYCSLFSFLISLIIDDAQSPAPIIKTLYFPLVLPQCDGCMKAAS